MNNKDKSNQRVAGENRIKYLNPTNPFEVSGNTLTINLRNGKQITGKNSDGFNTVFDRGFNG